MSIANSLYTFYLDTINKYSLEEWIGQLPLQTLLPNKSLNYAPTEHERNIYFCLLTGNDVMREYNWKYKARYVSET